MAETPLNNESTWAPVLRAHQQALATWLRAVEANPPASLVMTGPEGIGKSAFARNWAQTLMCAAAAADSEGAFRTACGECPSCRLIQRRQAVDLIELRPEVQESGRAGKISVDALRQIKELLGTSPLMGPYRVILIHDAHTMTVQAGNALLKILEEPPARWLIWMITAHRRSLLPTLVSRCQHVAFKPLDRATLQEMAQTLGVPEEVRPAALRLSGGNVRILEAMAQKEFWQRRQEILDGVSGSAMRKPLGPILDWCVESPENLERALLILEGRALESDERKRWELIRLIGEARQHLASPINRKLLIQNLLSQFNLRA